MKQTGHAVALILAFVSTASFARNMPHVELVTKYLQDGQYAKKMHECKARQMPASANSTGEGLDCWAANAASDLSKESRFVINLVLNASARDDALKRCAAASYEQRFKSEECAAAGRADTFIMLRLPRAVETLEPIKFK